MRRIVALVLVALGVALIALAIALPTYVYPRVAKVPADPNEYLVAQGEGISVLLAQSVTDGGIRLLSNQSVTATRRVRGEIRPNAPHPTGDEAFYRLAFQTVVANQPNGLLTAYVEGGSLNGKTGLANNCCGDYLNTDPTEPNAQPIHHEGLEFKFPFDTQRQSYPFWDVNVKRALTAHYAGTEKIHGLLTYRFVQPITDVVIAQQEVPGALLGLPEPSVKADRVYSDTRTLWVEPYTGAIIKGSEKINQRLVANGKQTPVIQGTLTYNEATVKHLVNEYQGSAQSLWFVTKAGPIAGWILGPILVLIGLALLLLPRNQEPEAAEAEYEPEDDPAAHAAEQSV
jgi:hypothetical protein